MIWVDMRLSELLFSAGQCTDNVLEYKQIHTYKHSHSQQVKEQVKAGDKASLLREHFRLCSVFSRSRSV